MADESSIDQWEDTKKTYKDLISEGFEVKAYDSTTIRSDNGLILILFVTVLQKNNEVKLDYFSNWMDVFQSSWVWFIIILDFI